MPSALRAMLHLAVLVYKYSCSTDSGVHNTLRSSNKAGPLGGHLLGVGRLSHLPSM